MSDSRAMGYLYIALQQVYKLLHESSFHSSVVHVVQCGRGTDTNACIVGSLLDSIYDVDDIPKKNMEKKRFYVLIPNNDCNVVLEERLKIF
jgi:hypothetical protein